MQKQRSISDRHFARERKRFPCEWKGSGRGGVCRRWDAYDPPMDARHTLRLRRADPCVEPIAGCPSRDVELANFMAPASKEENIKHPKSRRRESYMLTLPAPSAMCSSFLRPVSLYQTKTRSRPLIASPSDPPPVSLCHAIFSPCAQPRRARIHKVSGNSCTRARCGKGRCAGKRRAGGTQGAAGRGGEEQDGKEGGQGEEVENAPSGERSRADGARWMAWVFHFDC